MTIISRLFHGIKIGQRESDGYLNVTAMAKAYELSTGQRKDVRDWLNTERSKQYLDYLSLKTGQPVSLLIQVKRGGKAQGTWVHPKLAIPFATWLSVEFEFQVSEWVEEWLTVESTKQAKDSKERIRIEGKEVRREFTDAIADYLIRHEDRLSEEAIRFMYSNASDTLNLQIFNRRAKKLAEDFGVDRKNVRDGMTKKELRLVHQVEDTAMRLMDKDENLSPCHALKVAFSRLVISVQTRVAA